MVCQGYSFLSASAKQNFAKDDDLLVHSACKEEYTFVS